MRPGVGLVVEPVGEARALQDDRRDLGARERPGDQNGRSLYFEPSRRAEVRGRGDGGGSHAALGGCPARLPIPLGDMLEPPPGRRVDIELV
jgi:hypothetical protein